MDESTKMIGGLIAMLIGAGLLTYLTHHADPTTDYEFGRYEFDRKKKGKRKKHQPTADSPLSAPEDAVNTTDTTKTY